MHRLTMPSDTAEKDKRGEKKSETTNLQPKLNAISMDICCDSKHLVSRGSGQPGQASQLCPQYLAQQRRPLLGLAYRGCAGIQTFQFKKRTYRKDVALAQPTLESSKNGQSLPGTSLA